MSLVDFLKAHYDGTWEVETFDVPIERNNPSFEKEVTDWVINNVATQSQYRKYVFWAIWDPNPEEET